MICLGFTNIDAVSNQFNLVTQPKTKPVPLSVASFSASTPFERELKAFVIGGTLMSKKDSKN